MPAEPVLRDANVESALHDLTQEVRRKPADSKLRVYLFQLLCVQGQWDRALTQLNTAAELDPLTLVMAQMYREALQCEVFREDVFAGKRLPLVFGEPPEWIGGMIEALRLTGSGEQAAAADLRAHALEAAPATAGTIDGQPFEWIADADTRLGPILEVFVNGRYFWVPIERIKQIKIEAPTDLRDMIWTPAVFTWANEGQAVGIIPTRYPGSHLAADGYVRLSRKTEWTVPVEGVSIGLGQRMLATDENDYALLDVRQIDLNVE
jgi:type VI secretion system protein ImpE